MLYGSETWPLKVEQTAKLQRTQASMIRLMCGVKLNERMASQVLRERLGIEAIEDVVRRNRLRWFGHVERKEDSSWVKKCMTVEVDGKRPRGRPRLMWRQIVESDMKKMRLRTADAQDRLKWRNGIWEKPANPGRPGKNAVKR